MGSEAHLIIYTDLDGTLLDHETYSFGLAQEALKEVERRGIPLVLCTSKTRAEVEQYRQLLNNHDPFIVENGGATFIPKGYFAFAYPYQKEIAEYHVIEAGIPYPQLVAALNMAREESGVKVVGFSDLSAEEVARLTGLLPEEARLAKEREYDEPFLVHGSEEEAERVKVLLRKQGFLCTQGGRFDHLTGRNDKGRAVSTLTGLFQQAWGRVRTVGIGDSQNDLPMLRTVDVAILVQRPDETHDPTVRVPNLIRVRGIGPQGWRTAVLDLLVRQD
ncbi:mannosyl-3-phosphoglycerate phosphatase [Candidatus Methylomirabilis sp.]|uniref:mannosyl-3-phosphoglycerate phosphatase n=1 Tax=Candidatus Methylomirabilis sp. TaxID=2032687 RepID=UPI002A61ECC8|nr:mannosyl-3-phosphoglycerate phosphatase [Candidatus Methylomirabilis sp.]